MCGAIMPACVLPDVLSTHVTRHTYSIVKFLMIVRYLFCFNGARVRYCLVMWCSSLRCGLVAFRLPQNEVARAEAQLLAFTDEQYLVPTNGKPLRGLIQDHVDAGVKMCSKVRCVRRKSVHLHLVFGGRCGTKVVGIYTTAFTSKNTGFSGWVAEFVCV